MNSRALNLAPNPIDTAPKDGSMQRLWVRYPEGGSWTPLDDARESWTIGFNNLDNTEEDRWQVVGWCWSHDHIVEAAKDVEVLGWLPLHPETIDAASGAPVSFPGIGIGIEETLTTSRLSEILDYATAYDAFSSDTPDGATTPGSSPMNPARRFQIVALQELLNRRIYAGDGTALARDIEQAQAQLEAAQSAYLKRWGWKQTCSTPGSYWLWQRDFAVEDLERHAAWAAAGPGPLGMPSEPRAYGVITADRDLAVSMTLRSLDKRPEDGDGDDD